MENKKAQAVTADKAPKKSKSVFREYAEAIFIAFLLAIFIRTFIIQAFKIPSGSMEKTLLIGDHLLVSKFSYGVHVPNEIPFLNILSHLKNQIFDHIFLRNHEWHQLTIQE